MTTCDRCLGGQHIRCRGRFDNPCSCNLCGRKVVRLAPARPRATVARTTGRTWVRGQGKPESKNGTANAPLDIAGRERARAMLAAGTPVLHIAEALGTSRYHVKKAARGG